MGEEQELTRSTIIQNDQQLDTLQRENESLKFRLEDLLGKINCAEALQDDVISELQMQLSDLKMRVVQLQNQVADKDEIIHHLDADLVTLKRLQQLNDSAVATEQLLIRGNFHFGSFSDIQI